MRADRREFVAMCGGVLVQSFLSSRVGEAMPQRGAASPSKRKKVIIDTDPGVDDAFALLLALNSPELDVLAVTPVAGNVPLDRTLPNALRLVEIAGRTDVPVAAGAASPLVRRLIDATYAHGNNGLAGVEFPAPKLKPVSEPAAVLIERLVRANPAEVTIVGIGPLTNVAIALRQSPDLAPLIREFVLMGGSLSGGNVTPSAEFNFYVDPEAASIVFGSGVPIRMVGLDVTRKVDLTEQRVAALRTGRNPVSNAAARIGTAVLDMYRRENAQGAPHLHDPLAVSALLSSEVLTFEDYHVEIETTGTTTAGESLGWRRPPVYLSAPLRSTPSMTAQQSTPFVANAKVATGVDAEAFFELLIPRLTKAQA
jgi:inosine-uridine nucleoside N-ribohydrolase